MRTNMPVTNIEFELRESSSIVSKTDLKGIITYVNQDFIEASGFSEAELIGKPHNLVRHPDMPEEAFADLWRTLGANRPWTGLVKNRRKNGDYYWVVANATPIMEGGSCVGYMSVRSKPTRSQVEAHEAVYRLFKEGRQGALKIVEGKAVKETRWGALTGVLTNMNERKRMISVLLLLISALLLNGMFAYVTKQQTAEDVADIAVRRMQLNHDINQLQYLMADNRAQILLALKHNPTEKSSQLHEHPVTKHTDVIAANREKIDALMKNLEANSHSDKGRALFAEVKRTREAYVGEGIVPTAALILAGNYDVADGRLLNKVNPLRDESKKAIDAMIEHEMEGAQHAYEKVAAAESWAFRVQTTILILSLLVSSVVGWMLMNHIVGALRKAREQLNRISQGNYHDHIDVAHDDESGMLMYAMKAMQIRMGFEVSDAKRTADEMTRIKIGLDNVSTNVMIADKSRNIIYINQSILDMLSRTQDDIRTEFANFDAGKLIGSSLDQFYKNPAHQAQLLDRLRDTHRETLVLGHCTFALTYSAVINAQGEHLGTAVEWLDRTAELLIEQEVAQIVSAASQGDLSKRIDVGNKSGFIRTLSEGVNQMVGSTEGVINETVGALERIANGDMTCKIEADYQGAFGIIKDNANQTVDRLTETISRIKEAGDTINTAAKEISQGNTDLSQRTEEQAASLEETSASMEELTSTVKQNAENARQANQLAAGASDIAVRGGEVVGQVVHTMSAISDSSKKISDIISVIDGIAFQTNILALNAAVEAARAGEQGRGFAVVATEVRNLAQRSAGAAKEIKTLIGDSVDKVAQGTAQVDKAGKTMEEIVMAVKRVTDIMSEISAASAEQSSGIEQVNQAISQMDDVTQQNAALVEQAAAAAESLEEQAQELAQMMSTFRLSGERAALPLSAPRRAPARVAAAAPRAAAKPALPKPSKSDDEEWQEF